jgi:hypothetical protein
LRTFNVGYKGHKYFNRVRVIVSIYVFYKIKNEQISDVFFILSIDYSPNNPAGYVDGFYCLICIKGWGG